MAYAAPTRAAVAPRRRKLLAPGWWLPWLGVAFVLALLEGLSLTGVVDRRNFPPVSDMFAKLGAQAGESGFWTSVGHTLEGWAIGLGIASALAIPLGIVIGSTALLYRATRAVVEFLRPIPSVALIP